MVIHNALLTRVDSSCSSAAVVSTLRSFDHSQRANMGEVGGVAGAGRTIATSIGPWCASAACRNPNGRVYKDPLSPGTHYVASATRGVSSAPARARARAPRRGLAGPSAGPSQQSGSPSQRDDSSSQCGVASPCNAQMWWATDTRERARGIGSETRAYGGWLGGAGLYYRVTLLAESCYVVECAKLLWRTGGESMRRRPPP